MVLSRSAAVLVAAVTGCLAKTPAGFEPASNTDLIVEFSSIAALNGAVLPKEVTATQPRVGTTTRLTGTSYAVIMIDLDIPTNTSSTNTLLHWMQTGLTPATSPTMLNTTRGQNMVFLLQNTTQTSPAAPYIGPGPPARTPLSHRYTQILVDTSAVTKQATSALETAAETRLGFDAMTVLMQAGLAAKVVAGNSFNVTNPGPAQNTNGGGFTNSTTGSSGGKGATGTGSVSSPSASSTFVTGAGSVTGPSSGFVLALLGAGAVFLGL
ncbi:PEBP-like protein [Coniochaeta ligniaria NRRL 30616]|uniref:PEBP-like protein n=1 Tax=Coniochaeta ligniaria NRRL 30616 TaxID=1408157 RepID=A0A1J7IQJ9_9PEZI|nr:PEBP-like protein [Coniochaeta ligniaria NRRL 30616]